MGELGRSEGGREASHRLNDAHVSPCQGPGQCSLRQSNISHFHPLLRIQKPGKSLGPTLTTRKSQIIHKIITFLEHLLSGFL